MSSPLARPPRTRDRPALFLDRDGTIVRHVDYLVRADQLQLLEGAADAIARARVSGRAVVVVTNQPAVAHGFADEDAVREVHARLADLLDARGARVDAFYFCPHHPEAKLERYRVVCECRKPLPGMLMQAARALGIELAASVMIGDRLKDVGAGARAGCRTVLLGEAGRRPSADGWSEPVPDHVCADLGSAVDWALG
jgi:D-glycero-D-manno-heptose 1,7-bisphosphate phosphatase